MTEEERDSLFTHLKNKMDSIESHLLDLLLPQRKAYVKFQAAQTSVTQFRPISAQPIRPPVPGSPISHSEPDSTWPDIAPENKKKPKKVS